MENFVTKILKSSVWSSIALAILGILLFFYSELTIVSISYLIGGVLIGIGVISLIKFIAGMNKDKKNEMDVVYGIITIVLGIIVITNPKAIASIIPFILGILMVISSSTKILYSFDLKKNASNLWVSTLIVGVLTLVCGVLLIFNPFAGADFFVKAIGIILFIYAVLDIISGIRIYKIVKGVSKDKKKIEDKIVEADVVEDNTSEDRKSKKESKEEE